MFRLTESTNCALRLCAGYPAPPTVHLIEASGLDLHLTLALELLVRERREIDVLTKKPRMAGATTSAFSTRSNARTSGILEADPERRLQGILDGNVAHAC
jgi:hypothetical protein